MIEETSDLNKRAYYDINASAIVSQQDVREKNKKKRQKRIKKKIKPQPLIEMFDESKRVYDKPISVRQVLRKRKVDLSWINFLAWSLEAYRELKRLCTKIAKKRASRTKPTNPNVPVINPFLLSTSFNPSIYVMSILSPLTSIFPKGTLSIAKFNFMRLSVLGQFTISLAQHSISN